MLFADGNGHLVPMSSRPHPNRRVPLTSRISLLFVLGFSIVKPYEELVQFIASLSPREVVDFKPSESARQRVWDLIERKKTSPLPAAENSELDHYLEIEHLMRLAKARARQLLTHRQ
jgi:hypothetical protein